ncbi:MAG TPA: hypothetical protein VN915_03240 [Elusimicrobiota bacterium]|nr:hypothetical protein [Elusimicrobiota bacterium]
MKKRLDSPRRGAAPKRGRKGTRKCPCCGSTPCSCEKNCFCQELKGGLDDDDEADVESAGLDDDLQFAFLRYGEQGV